MPAGLPRTSDQLFVLAEWYAQLAKRVLERDGYHTTMVFSYGPEGVTPEVLVPEDKTDKYVLWNRLADRVERNRDWAVLSIGEMWFASAEGVDLSTLSSVADLPNRREALVVAAAHRDGKSRSYTSVFNRDADGNIAFEKTWPSFSPNSAMNFFIPVMKVWQEWRRKESGNAEEPLFHDARPARRRPTPTS